MVTPKEPHYFAVDYPGARYVTEICEYERLFARADARHLAAGDASPGYLGSHKAVTLIHAYNPDARLIVTLRNPAELLVSYHSQLLFSLYEDQEDLETAWRLQDERRLGRHIPPYCREPLMLQYREMMCLGDQLQRLLSTFPREQVLIIFYEDFRDRPGAVYQQVLAFIGVPDDGRQEFRVINAKKVPRWRWMNVLLHSPPAWMLGLMRRLSGTTLHDAAVRLHGALKAANAAPVASRPTTVSLYLQAELAAAFLPQVELLERLTGRDLRAWKAPRPVG